MIIQRPMLDERVKVLKESNKARFLEHFVQFTAGRFQVLPRLMARAIPLFDRSTGGGGDRATTTPPKTRGYCNVRGRVKNTTKKWAERAHSVPYLFVMENFDNGVEVMPRSFGEMFLDGTVKDGAIGGIIDDGTGEIGPRRGGGGGAAAPMLFLFRP
jgi:hypothetical protein